MLQSVVSPLSVHTLLFGIMRINLLFLLQRAPSVVCTLYEHGSSVAETIVPGDQSRSCDCTITVSPGLSGANSLVPWS